MKSIKINRDNWNNILFYLIIVNAPLDFLVSLSRRFNSIILSPASFIRGATFLFAFLYLSYVSFIEKSKKTTGIVKLNRIVILLSVFINITFLISRPDGYRLTNYVIDINDLIRYLYFPMCFLFFINMNFHRDLKSYNTIQKGVKLLVFMYSFLVVFPYMTGTSFPSYSIDYLSGNVGWLYGANEIGLIIGLLLSFYFIDIYEEKTSFFGMLNIMLASFALIIVGTKGALLLLAAFFMGVTIILLRRIEVNKKSKSFYVCFSLMLIIVFFIVINTPAVANTINLIKGKNISQLMSTLLSGRLTFLDMSVSNYIKSPLLLKIVGVGVQSIDHLGNIYRYPLIEMDVFDIFISYGVINLIIIYLPYLITLIQLKNTNYITKNERKANIYYLGFVITLSFIISFMIGHVVSTPSVSFIVLLLMLTFLNTIFVDLNDYSSKTKNMDKMSSLFSKVYGDDEKSLIKKLISNMDLGVKNIVVTANPEIIVKSPNDADVYQGMLSNDTIITADGIGVIVASKIINDESKHKITGVDIVDNLINGSTRNRRLVIYGSKQEVLDKYNLHLVKLGYTDVHLYNGYDYNDDDMYSVVRQLKPDILLVCLGVPKQEKFIFRVSPELEKGILIGCGGSIDVLSGDKMRAPKIFQKTNTEWLYRIMAEPKRLKRFYESNVKFMINIINHKFDTFMIKLKIRRT